MIKISNVEVVGWEHAIRGMRNPKNSWDKSDSFECDGEYCIRNNCNYSYCTGGEHYDDNECMLPDGVNYVIGANDLDLMRRLASAGSDHSKYRRMIVVYADIVAPLYWWKEFETYKVGTVANSCSTMHKIHDKAFNLDDFSYEHLSDDALMALCGLCGVLNSCREQYLETKDKAYWWDMIQLLPSSYNQKRTVMLNYEVLANIYKSRRTHKLDEWRELCKWIESLPYSEIITGGVKNE